MFVPGGDPGDNVAKDLMPYATEMAAILRKLSSAGEDLDLDAGIPQPGRRRFLRLIKDTNAELARRRGDGAERVHRSKSTRRRLPKKYNCAGIRTCTHIVRGRSIPIPWLDPVWGMTLGREPVNPRPVRLLGDLSQRLPVTDGFLSYSDGITTTSTKTCGRSWVGAGPPAAGNCRRLRPLLFPPGSCLRRGRCH